jgi:hypothetical protein
VQTEFTKDIIELAFDEMGALAAARGITIEIAVDGGFCLILASTFETPQVTSTRCFSPAARPFAR